MNKKSCAFVLIGLLCGAFLPSYASGSARNLEGCRDVDKIGTVLSRIEKLDWNMLSLEHVQAIWPSKLEAFDCSNNKCRSLVYQGRMINGFLYCGQKIDLDQQLNRNEGASKSLTVTIHYSSTDKKHVVEVVKSLAAAGGLSKDEVNALDSREKSRVGFKNVHGDNMGLFVNFTVRNGIATAVIQIDRILTSTAH